MFLWRYSMTDFLTGFFLGLAVAWFYASHLIRKDFSR